MSSQSPTPPSTRSPISTSWTVRLWVPQTSKITWGSRLMAGWDGTSTSITSAVQQTGCWAFSGGTCTSALKTWRRRPTRPYTSQGTILCQHLGPPPTQVPWQAWIVQCMAARFVINQPYRCSEPVVSVTVMIQDLGWEPLWMGRLQCRLTSFYKVVNNHLKIAQSYHPQPAQGLRVTRGHDKRLQPYLPEVDAFKYSFFLPTVVDWNQLLAETVHAKSAEAFKLSLYYSKQ